MSDVTITSVADNELLAYDNTSSKFINQTPAEAGLLTQTEIFLLLGAKAPLASPALTGNPTAPTQSASDNSTKIATTAYTDTAISNLVDSSPAALNTLNELAAALGDDANFSTTVTNSIATKLNSSAVSTFGLTLIDDADAAAARTTLGAAATSHTQASSTITDFASAASAEAIPFAIALG